MTPNFPFNQICMGLNFGSPDTYVWQTCGNPSMYTSTVVMVSHSSESTLMVNFSYNIYCYTMSLSEGQSLNHHSRLQRYRFQIGPATIFVRELTTIRQKNILTFVKIA